MVRWAGWFLTAFNVLLLVGALYLHREYKRSRHALIPGSKHALLETVTVYVAALETSLSDGTCLCEWQIVKVDTRTLKRKMDTHPFCPVHTREGLIIHFLQTYFPDLYPGERLSLDKLPDQT